MLTLTDENEIEAAFRYYRKRGFPYPRLSKHERIHIFRQLQNYIPKINRHVDLLFGGCKIITRTQINDVTLANMFHPHLWESHATGMKSPIQSFNIDKSLEKVFRMCLQYDHIITDDNVRHWLCHVNGTQVCSNFRPSSAKAIYDYFHTTNTLDMSMGFGGRLLGFLASKATGTYVGVDPCRKTYEGNLRLAKAFKASHHVKLICAPFEDVPIEELGEPDFAFTSPPYFCKEIYENAQTQSSIRYLTYPKWRKQFLFVMLEKTHNVLQRGGTLVLNICDVKIRRQQYPLVDDSRRFAERLGFHCIDPLFFQISGFGKNVKGAKSEPLLVFKK